MKTFKHPLSLAVNSAAFMVMGGVVAHPSYLKGEDVVDSG